MTIAPSPHALRIAVIGGGENCEHEISLASADSVAAALSGIGHEVVPLTIDPHGGWLDGDGTPIGLAAAVDVLCGCDVVVPVVHGPRGEDGTLAALCDLAGVAFVGSGIRPGALAMDKWATKLVAQALGITTAASVVLTTSTASTYRFRGPVVVKPIAAGSSHGVRLVDSEAELAPALAAAFAFDDRVLVEEVQHGREIDVAVLGMNDGGRHVSPLLEIVADGLFDHDAKYGGHADFRVPAEVSLSERNALVAAALAMYDALGCAGVARIDFFLTESGPVLNEVNTMPGFTAHSQVPQMFAADGLTYTALLDTLVQDAAAAGARRPTTAVSEGRVPSR
ncbi:D-alanine--D-alanine ligase family protein [Nocardia sp. JMUB6875]|uniref:D-alanine--D-alanine ligase family protein n=1 Tax=Nocardia sp. JMUB6875 TaxID=3158170 RepID=UPI0032E68AA4